MSEGLVRMLIRQHRDEQVGERGEIEQRQVQVVESLIWNEDLVADVRTVQRY